jgi:phage tail-like protein
MSDFLPAKNGYYLSVIKTSDRRRTTSIYRTNNHLEKEYHLKDTYGIGNGLFSDSSGMYQWFNDTWSLNYYVLGDVFNQSKHSKDNIVTGHYISKCFDTYYENENWHRYLVDFINSINTRIKIYFFTSDENRIVINNRKFSINELMISEDFSFEEKKEYLCQKKFYKSESLNCRDGLFQNTKGRYLWFYLELIGTTVKSPFVSTIQLIYRRQSYLRYLPEVYQEDKESAGFLERFLSVFESYLSDMEEKIGSVHKSFEPDLNSGDSLKWLSTWLGYDLDDSWTDDQIRKLIKIAPELYKRKGTKSAIIKFLEIYLSGKPQIIESFEVKDYKLSNDSKHKLYDSNPFVFYVLVSKEQASSKVKISNIMSILKFMKPAHTQAKLVILERNMLLGDHSYIGMNTVLSGYNQLRLDNQTYLLNDTVIYDVVEEDRISKDARLDRETYLK